MSGDELVTVIVPVRNEADDIAECLECLLAQTWPRELLQVVVADGASADETAKIAERVLAGAGLAGWTIVESAKGSTPSNLNAGLGEARGSYICRVDGRSLVPPHYVATCVQVLSTRPEVVVVGGSQRAEARHGATLVARAIARALRNPYATGLARYRRSSATGPTDTVYLGAFRAADLRSVGGWNERFATNQDYELNRRLGEQGIVWFDSRLAVTYRPRQSLTALFHQHRRFGRWKAAGWLEAAVRIRPRQALLVTGPPFVGTLAVAQARHRPLTLLGAVGVGAIVLDAASREPGPIPERALGLVAVLVLGVGWWLGVAEQTCRRAIGQRLFP